MPDADILIQRYVEGTLTEAEAAELHTLLNEQPDLGARLLDQFNMDAMLRATKPMAASIDLHPVILPSRRFSFATVTSVAAMAACVTLLGTWAMISYREPTVAAEETTASVAVLTRGVNLVWESGAISPGTPLSPGWLKLRSGIAQIEFYQGARVLIEGPAALQLISSGEATCTSGKLSAHVPPQARGFKINTPRGTLVDLGTEFGLDVSSENAQVHVFKGEVEFHPPSMAMKSLREGEAMTFAQTPVPLAANAAAFSSLSQMDERTAASLRSQYESWQAASTERNLDPNLRLRFDFQDNNESRTLRNRAAHGASIADGSIVGGAWTEGRWPGKHALEFRNVSDRVRLNIPGELKQLTLAVWVRVNGLDRTFNSLFMSESWGDRKIHWQITREGKVRFGIAGTGKEHHTDNDSPVLFTPERFGRWIHLAVVFDPTRREVRHYADGDLISRNALKDVSPLKLGMAELGNWNDHRGNGGVAIRYLSGAMDEFALWDRVLTDAEIARLAR